MGHEYGAIPIEKLNMAPSFWGKTRKTAINQRHDRKSGDIRCQGNY
jgi:hypothetical protein